MNTLKEYTSAFEQAISTLALPGGNLAGLYAPIAYGLDTGGKRLRPVLTLLAAKAYGIDLQKALPVALAIEMFHNFTLIHDDVMDNSPTRRGKDTVHKRWNSNTAILSGDTLYGLCYQQLLRLSPDILPAALQMFNDTAIEVFEGQHYDMDFENRQEVSIEEYLEMIRLKTSVLLGGAAALGAITAEAPDKDIQAWYTYGEALGLAFQIQDDYLDVYGDPLTFGKPIGGDILNDKKTFLTTTALRMEQADKLKQVMSLPASHEKIDAVRELYNQMGIPEICINTIKEYTDNAIDALKELEMPVEIRNILTSLALKLAQRQQ